jgi:sodium/proline symporter
VTPVVASFVACLLGFAIVGVLSFRRSQGTTDDYLVAGRSVSPWLTALSSAATNNSGFMFIGLFGFTYRFGVQAVWLQAGWVVGDLVAWLCVHRRVRERSGRLGLASVPQLIATDDRGRRSRPIATGAAVLTLVFLGGYAAAQLRAGSAALTGVFGWNPAVGIVLGAAIVVAYCFSGGLRASIWTDAAQALVMLGSLAALVGFAAAHVGGPSALLSALAAADPSLVAWIPHGLAAGFGLYLLGFVFGGLGVVGQPHILVRSMAIRSGDDIARARDIYFLWYVPFSAAAVLAGLYGRVLVPDLLAGVAAAETAVVAETALPALAGKVLPEILMGTLLAGVFAATLSTADSQILSCSAAVTQDLAPKHRASMVAAKSATLGVAALALTIALVADEDVFGLVLGAWSALGASLGPLLLIRLVGLPLPSGRALAMMATGVLTVTLWGHSPLADDVFELLPGMLAPLAVYAAAGFLAARRRQGRSLTAARLRREPGSAPRRDPPHS